MNDDDLEHLLSSLEVAVDSTVICEIERGVRLVLEAKRCVEFHYVLDGTLHLRVSGSPPLVCRAGTLVIVPSGASQSLAAHSSPKRELRPMDRCSSVDLGFHPYDAATAKADDLRLLCGTIIPSGAGAFGLLGRLLEPVATDLSDAPIVRQAFGAVLKEISAPRVGTRALVGTLMKMCLLKMLQRHLDTPEERSRLFAAIRAPHLQKVVAEVWARPAADYDVQSLAAISGMSRSAFAREFVEVYGLTPMRFVTIARLHRAAELLRSTATPVKVVAGMVGFASRSHFSRAFRDFYGKDPLSFRANSEPHFPVLRQLGLASRHTRSL